MPSSGAGSKGALPKEKEIPRQRRQRIFKKRNLKGRLVSQGN